MTTDDPVHNAREAGFDLDLIDANLARSPEERLRLHDEALHVVLELCAARETRDAKLHATPAASR